MILLILNSLLIHSLFPEKPIQKEFVDYEFFVSNKSRIVKLFSNKEKKLRFVSKNSNGIIINENEKVDIKIKLSDYDKKKHLFGDSINWIRK